MHFVYQTTASGGIDLLKVRDDGTTRPILENDPSFLEWRSKGNNPALLPYTPPLRDLETERAAKLAAVQALKVTKRDAGFTVDGILFDSDMAARLAYAELAIRLQQNPALETAWKASSGVWVSMDAALFARLSTVGVAHIEAVFARQAALDYLIQQAASVEELDALDITAGW